MTECTTGRPSFSVQDITNADTRLLEALQERGASVAVMLGHRPTRLSAEAVANYYWDALGGKPQRGKTFIETEINLLTSAAEEETFTETDINLITSATTPEVLPALAETKDAVHLHPIILEDSTQTPSHWETTRYRQTGYFQGVDYKSFRSNGTEHWGKHGHAQ